MKRSNILITLLASMLLTAGICACGGAEEAEDSQSALYSVGTHEAIPPVGNQCSARTGSGMTCKGVVAADGYCKGTNSSGGSCEVSCSNNPCKDLGSSIR